MRRSKRPVIATILLTAALLFGFSSAPASAGSTSVSSNGCTAWASVYNSGGKAYIKVAGSNSYWCVAVQGTLYYKTWGGANAVAGPYTDWSKPHYILAARPGTERFGKVCVLPRWGGWTCKYFG